MPVGRSVVGGAADLDAGHAAPLVRAGLHRGGEVPVELLVQFSQPSGDAPFMYHCHILEHEDNGMMGQYAAT